LYLEVCGVHGACYTVNADEMGGVLVTIAETHLACGEGNLSSTFMFTNE